MRGFPWLLLHQRFGLDGRSAQGHVAVFKSAATRFAFSVGAQGVGQGIHQNATWRASEYVAHIERRAVGTDDWNSGSVAKGNRMFAGHEHGTEHRAHDAGVALGSNADARSKASLDGELRGVFAGDEKPALLHELLQMGKAFVP